MKATEKEKKCIDFSLMIRKKVLEQEIYKLKKDKTPLLLSPKGFVEHFWQDYHTTKKMTTPIKGAIFTLIFYVIYIIALPLVFIFGVIDKFIPSNKKNKEELKSKYLIDYEISDLKSFELFWDSKGLRDWGVGFYHLKFTNEDKLECLRFWCKTLYQIEEEHFNKLIEGAKDRIAISRQKFYAENPNGHISMASPIQILPEEIQTKFGNYNS